MSDNLSPQAEMATELAAYFDDVLDDECLSRLDVLDALASLGYALVDMSGLENPAAQAYFDILRETRSM